MPQLVALAAALNDKFAPDKIQAVDPATLASESDLFSAIEALGIDLSDNEKTFLEAVPDGQKQAIQGALQSAAARNTPVMFAWVPGYDFELRLFEARENGGATSMTMIFSSPYLRSRTG